MPHTNSTDVLLYGSVNEHGLNRAFELMQRQRPSLFTYATHDIATHPDKLPPTIAARLTAIEAANPELKKHGYLEITEERSLPVVFTGGTYALDYAVHLAVAAIDVDPPSVIAMPPARPLPAQRMAFHVEVLGAVGIPSPAMVSQLPPLPVTDKLPELKLDLDATNPTVIGPHDWATFQADLYLVGGAAFHGDRVKVFYDGLTFTGVFDPHIEALLEAYARLVVQLVVVPRLEARIPTHRVVTPGKLPAGISLPLAYDVALSRRIAPITANTEALPNPSFESDEVRVFLTATQVPVPPPANNTPPAGTDPSGTDDGGLPRGGPDSPPPGGSTTTDVTGAVSATLVERVFADVVATLTGDFPGDTGSGVFKLSYDAAFHLRNDGAMTPTVTLQDDGTIYLRNLHVLWDRLRLTIDINIPTWVIGGDCLLWWEGKCAIRTPQVTFFGANPDLSIPLALDGVVNSSMSVDVGGRMAYWRNPARPPTESDWDAHVNKRPNGWRFRLNTPHVLVEPIDIVDTINAAFDAAVNVELDKLLKGVDDWAKDIVKAFLGGVAGIVKTLLSAAASFTDWLAQQLNLKDGFLGTVETLVAQWLEARFTIPLTEDPVVLLKPDPVKRVGPVLVPVSAVKLTINSSELVLEGSLG